MKRRMQFWPPIDALIGLFLALLACAAAGLFDQK